MIGLDDDASDGVMTRDRLLGTALSVLVHV